MQRHWFVKEFRDSDHCVDLCKQFNRLWASCWRVSDSDGYDLFMMTNLFLNNSSTDSDIWHFEIHIIIIIIELHLQHHPAFIITWFRLMRPHAPHSLTRLCDTHHCPVLMMMYAPGVDDVDSESDWSVYLCCSRHVKSPFMLYKIIHYDDALNEFTG